MKTPALERVIAGMALLLLTPVFAVVATVVRVDSRGPAFYRAQRVGQGGSRFVLFKFRSMVVESGSADGARVTVAGDSRVTRVGRLLRASKVDELPQLLNIARGEMRFVGPRPEDPVYVELADPLQQEILRVPPGITGPASIAYRSEEAVLAELMASGTTHGDAYRQVAQAKRDIDVEYLRTRSWRSDMAILWRTFKAVSEKVEHPQ